MTGLLDRYDRKARLTPAALASLPGAILLLSLGWALGEPIMGALVGVLIQFGVPVAMANYTRIAGKRLEVALWETWGGPPTTQRIRHRGNPNHYRLELVHYGLARLVPEMAMPTKADEAASSSDADRRWDAIVDVARSRLRDHDRSRLLFEENCTYGFHRNMLGVRKLGLWIAVGSVVTASVGAGIQLGTGGAPISLLIATAAAGAAALGWYRVSAEQVRSAAFAYADAFVAALLVDDTRAPTGSGGSPEI